MNKSHLIGALCVALCSFISLPSQAAFIGRLPATPGGADYQAYYDDQLGITWVANANINGADTWDNQVDWVTGLTIGGVGGWRLPNMDVNNDGTIVNCTSSGTQAACKDNEYGHLYYYGAGTAWANGVLFGNEDPFNDIAPYIYWSSNAVIGTVDAKAFAMTNGQPTQAWTENLFHAWAVHSGDVSAVPVPAAIWLFGSGLLGLIGISRRKKA